MKRNKWLTCVTGFGLAILLGCSSIGCFVSAFAPAVVQKETVYLWCVAMALCWSICYTWKLQMIPMCILALLTGYLWYGGSLEKSVEGLIYQLSVCYDSAYGCGVISWSGTFPINADVTLALCGVATLITLAVCRTICILRSAWLAVMAALIPLAACMVVTNLIPSQLWLGLLLTGVALLILPNTLRRRDPVQGAVLTALVTLPVVLAVTVLLLAVPKEHYHGQSRANTIADTLLEWLPSAEQLEKVVGSAISGAMETDSVDLSSIGRRNNTRIIVMQVSGTSTGTVYLRGQHLDKYDGYSWCRSGLDDTMPWLPEAHLLEPAGTLQITTRYTLPTVYVPYYAAEPGQSWNGERIENRNDLRTYDYARKRLVTGWQGLQEGTGEAEESWLQLPTQTRIWAQALLADILSDDQPMTEKAEAIGRFVRSSAKYNTDVTSMPALETDFVRWFLEDCEEGYCIHFASSAVVLLRAAGIPARYVTGYMTTLDSSGQATVRLDDAHAWAEYYVGGIGWVLLETTPPLQATVQQTESQPVETSMSAASTTPSVPSQSIPAETLPGRPEPPSDTERLQQDTGWLQKTVKTVCFAGLFVLVVWLQRRLRLALRLRRLRSGSVNDRAVAMWREVAYLSRLLSEQPQSELFATAQKAKFSQHTLRLEELAPLDAYIRQARTRLCQKSLFWRFVYQIILAVC